MTSVPTGRRHVPAVFVASLARFTSTGLLADGLPVAEAALIVEGTIEYRIENAIRALLSLDSCSATVTVKLPVLVGSGRKIPVTNLGAHGLLSS
jgi:hypothetical protein